MAETDNAVWRCLHCPTKIYGTGVKEQKERLQAMIDEHMETHNNQPEQLNTQECPKCHRTSDVVKLNESCPFCDTQEWEKKTDEIYDWQKKILKEELNAIYGGINDEIQLVLSEERLYGTMLAGGIDKMNELISKAVSKEQARIIEIIEKMKKTNKDKPYYLERDGDIEYNETLSDIIKAITHREE